ncbi:hypothetical protein D3C80_1872490 [compost metagenome]
MQHRADHRHGEEALQVAVAVPIEQCDSIARLDAGCDQRIGQAADALVERAVVVAQFVGVDDLLLGRVARTREQQAFDQQRVVVGAFCRGNYFCFHHNGLPEFIVWRSSPVGALRTARRRAGTATHCQP